MSYTIKDMADRIRAFSPEQALELAIGFALLSKDLGSPQETLTDKLTPEAALIDISLNEIAGLRRELAQLASGRAHKPQIDFRNHSAEAASLAPIGTRLKSANAGANRRA